MHRLLLVVRWLTYVVILLVWIPTFFAFAGLTLLSDLVRP